MKKLMIGLAVVSMSASALAQEVEIIETPAEKYSVATNSFWSNWFLTFQGAYTNFLDAGQANGDQLFKGDYANVGASVALGKWFTPGLGLRMKMNAWQLKYQMPESTRNEKDYYGALTGDVMFNLSNLFMGYNEDRVWNVIPYVGAGVIRNCSRNHYSPALSVGLISTWRLGKHVNFNVEANLINTTKSFAATDGGAGGFAHGSDKLFNIEAGFTFNLGKSTWDRVPDVDAIMAANQYQVDALNAALAESQAENAKMREMLSHAPKEKIVTKEIHSFASVPASVFFNLDKAEIASKKDMVNLQALADYAKANGSHVTVTGYADSATGSAVYNQDLSERRAQAVADILVEMGVSRSQITAKGNGGVDTLVPDSYNRRAIIEIK